MWTLILLNISLKQISCKEKDTGKHFPNRVAQRTKKTSVMSVGLVEIVDRLDQYHARHILNLERVCPRTDGSLSLSPQDGQCD